MDHRITFHALEGIQPEQYANRIAEFFDAAILQVIVNMQNHDMVRFHKCSQAWVRDLNIPFMTANELTGFCMLE